MGHGYAGKLLFVDLSTGALVEETPDEGFYRSCIGGTGMGAKVMMERTKPGIDPLGAREHAGLRHRTAHRHRRVRRGPVHGDHQVAAHRRLGGLQFRRHLGTGTQERRVRRGLHYRRGGAPRLPGHRRGPGAAHRRRPAVGQGHVRDRRPPASGTGRSGHLDHLVHRPGGRAVLAPGRHRQRKGPDGGPLRRRSRHGFEEAQSRGSSGGEGRPHQRGRQEGPESGAGGLLAGPQRKPFPYGAHRRRHRSGHEFPPFHRRQPHRELDGNRHRRFPDGQQPGRRQDGRLQAQELRLQRLSRPLRRARADR